MAAVAALAATVVGAGATWVATRPAAPELTRLTISDFGNSALRLAQGNNDIALSPDGRHLVYVTTDIPSQLRIRSLDEFEDRLLFEGPVAAPFFSWDGSQVAFGSRDQ